ncbi:DUF1156 domain-containing protein [Oligosphaera ethanolica]|uniref:Adenine-specific DNA methylase n=1 Tax=Oligosphaera ethanolica TaxID=760260 RepID=A0AAE4ANJ2_9BACT|nr:DUF1156 domain-containing protein [Oligosphaera ethanolica]MDQ0289480.1 adenine-specific DNA methylase [Oligosphaera ethanolica]
MDSTTRYPKRLIEVDLPIKRISAHARREKSIRHGHISTLHIWWARRPLAACRAVICAALWPDPADENCPPEFIEAAKREMLGWAPYERQAMMSVESQERFNAARKDAGLFDDPVELRHALLDFIADFANWDNSTNLDYLATARALTQAAHEALGGVPGTRPLVVDPFAGGGAIPLEALRVGADAFASDLNPVAVLLNKVVLEYIPKYGQRLADEVRKWGQWIKEQAEKELVAFYPKDPDGATPIAYLWARTVQCEGPGCGAEVPLIRSLWLAKKGSCSVALRIVPNPVQKRVDFEIIQNAKSGNVGEGTVRRGSATCPCCGFTTPVASVRVQMKARKGGANDARLLAVVTTRKNQQGRLYRLPTNADIKAVCDATSEIEKRGQSWKGPLSLVPNEPLPLMSGVFNVPIYGHTDWGTLFTARQALSISTIARLVVDCGATLNMAEDNTMSTALKTCLSLAMDRQADYTTSLCSWHLTGEKLNHTYGRQALGMIWDFAEVCPFANGSGNFEGAFSWVADVCERVARSTIVQGHVERASATAHPLPDNSAKLFATDPPYYNAVPYADLSDFFYVWLRRTLTPEHPDLFTEDTSPKDHELCEMAGWDPLRYSNKNAQWYEQQMGMAMADGRRVLSPDGVGIVVFAHKSTSGWEAQLQAMIQGGWVITGSWPIDTEMGARLRAQNSAVLASSVHLVCRPREAPDGSLVQGKVGEWREVLAELPKRIHEWMPRLAAEGVVGADAIFACLGPALEVFSRYARVEKASGEQVSLRDYLEQVWAAVSQEALHLVFEGADASGFEEDARLTAMWLWTLGSGNGQETGNSADAEDGDDSDEDSGSAKKKVSGGYVLEYDTARKIAQGLGAHLETLGTVVEVKGETARLLPVAERTKALFGKDQADAPVGRKKKKDTQQMLPMFQELEQAETESGWGEKGAPKVGETTLDRVHQTMILFAAGRSEALRRFLVEEGVGRDGRFWTLAQSLSALYPTASDEKRWVDGILARKKGLGF